MNTYHTEARLVRWTDTVLLDEQLIKVDRLVRLTDNLVRVEGEAWDILGDGTTRFYGTVFFTLHGTDTIEVLLEEEEEAEVR